MSKLAYEGEKRIKKYLLENSAPPEATIPNDDKVVTPSSNTEPEGKKPTPKNTEFETYEYSDDKEADDKDW